MLTRRTIAQGLTAAAGLTGLSVTTALAGSHAAMFTKDDWMKALVKLRGSSEDEMVVWWLKGVLYGVVDEEATKLWNMETVSFARWEKRGDEYAYGHYELSLRLDLETNEFLTSFTNPYTDETLDMELAPFGPNVTLLTATGARVPDDAPIQPALTHDIGPPVILGDEIWMPQDLFAALPAFAPGMKPWRANDITTYQGKLSDVLNDDIAFRPCNLHLSGLLRLAALAQHGNPPRPSFGAHVRAETCEHGRHPPLLSRHRRKRDAQFLTESRSGVGIGLAPTA